MSEMNDIYIIDQLTDAVTRLYRYYANTMYAITVLLIVLIPILLPSDIFIVLISFATYTLLSGLSIAQQIRNRTTVQTYLYTLKETQVFKNSLRRMGLYFIILLIVFGITLFYPFLFLALVIPLYIFYLWRLTQISTKYADTLTILKQKHEQQKEVQQQKLDQDSTAQTYLDNWVRTERITRMIIIVYLAFLSLTLPYASLAEIYSMSLVFTVVIIAGISMIVYSVRNFNKTRIRIQITEINTSSWRSSTRLTLAVAIYTFLHIMMLGNFGVDEIMGAVFFSCPVFLISWLNWRRVAKSRSLREMLA